MIYTPISCPYTLRFVNSYPKPNLKCSSIRNFTRISGAIVIADAERCFKRLDAPRGSVRAAHQPAM